jgi:excisionase family DNA binding protein
MSTAPQPEPDRLWTPADVATYLQASRSWVYQRAADGTLPALRIGGMLRFDPIHGFNGYDDRSCSDTEREFLRLNGYVLDHGTWRRPS